MTTSDERPNDAPRDASDLGPDPVWGVGLFVVGLIVMAVGGAMTWHYVFNAGEALLLLGSGIFLLFVAISSQKQDPIRWRTVLRRALGRDDRQDDAEAAEGASGRGSSSSRST